MNLPRKYLSYSAISLWERNKKEYRQRYYENIVSPSTPEMIYGKKIARILEMGKFDDHPTLGKIPRYEVPEHKIEIMVEDIPVMGYLDSFDPKENRYIEYKTGRNNIDGTPRWDKLAVYKTDQLPMYSLLVKEKYGTVENLSHLVWLRTVFSKKTVQFGEHTLSSEDSDVIIDGHYEIFPRRVFEYERRSMRGKIIKVAKEIEEDYAAYQRAKSLTLPPVAETVVG